MTKIWQIVKDTVYGFIEDEALTRGAAIAFYTATSIAPVLLIAIAIAAVAFGQDAAQNAITGQLSGLMGDQAAQLLQSAVANASSALRSRAWLGRGSSAWDSLPLSGFCCSYRSS
jgi:membrane protein